MDDLRYDRLCRTAESEAYLLSDGEQPVGRVDLHYTSSVVYGMLVLERETPESDVQDLIERIDEDLVWTADVARDDFVVTVYQGKEVGVYSDPHYGDQEEDGMAEEN
jgi:hypothetical protein